MTFALTLATGNLSVAQVNTKALLDPQDTLWSEENFHILWQRAFGRL